MFARVAVLTERGALSQTYTYEIPAGFGQCEAGWCLVVPFQTQTRIGYVVETFQSPDVARTRAAIGRVPGADIPPARLTLARWMAGYWFTSVGACLRLMLPPAMRGRIERRVRAAVEEPPETVRGMRSDVLRFLLEHGPATLAAVHRTFGKTAGLRALAELRRLGFVVEEAEIARAEGAPRTERYYAIPGGTDAQQWLDANARRRPAQADILRFLLEQQAPASHEEISQRFPSPTRALSALVRAGMVAQSSEEKLRRPREIEGRDLAVTLTPGQSEAVREIVNAIDSRGHTCTREILLYGVTASGKTEVYLRAIQHALDRGLGALVLMPEIALTVHAVGQFRQRFGERLAVLHSRLTAGERADEWRRIQSGVACVVLGPRSAVFAPLENPGLIIMDEEHEPAFKQESDPRYHARDVCRWLSEAHDIPLVLGTATPCVETYHAGREGKIRVCDLPSRIDDRPMPRIRIVDMRPFAAEGTLTILSQPLRDCLVQNLSAGGQSIVYLNRRAYGTFVLCRECGYVAACPNCAVSAKYHREDRSIRCHHCGWRARSPQQCPSCEGTRIASFGIGTQRVEEELRAVVPDARLLRMDRDTTASRDALVELIERFRRKEADILVGTQMVAKGLDFPGVLLVGVVNADTGMQMPDFRAAERGFQLLTQVAGRAGRGEQPGEVVLQTFQPEHYAISAAASQDYASFFEQELAARSEMGWPPFASIARVVIQSASEGHCRDEARRIAGILSADGAVEVIGPSAAPIEKLKSRHRWHILLRSPDRGGILELLERVDAHRWPSEVSIDIDPVNLM